MTESESVALPLGDAAMFILFCLPCALRCRRCLVYQKKSDLSIPFLKKIQKNLKNFFMLQKGTNLRFLRFFFEVILVIFTVLW